MISAREAPPGGGDVGGSLWDGVVLRGWAEEGEEEAGARRAAPGPLMEPVEGFEEGGGGEADEGAGPMMTEKDLEMKNVLARSRHAKLKTGRGDG
jgi:hypothetical protein